MLLLEPQNLLIQKAFSEAFAADYKPVSIDRIVTDFDFTAYHLSTPRDKNGILLSVGIKCWDDLVRYGTVELLHSIYAKYSSFIQELAGANAEPGYNYGLYVQLDQANLGSPEAVAELVDELSLLKRNCFAAPFLKAFQRYEVLASEEPVDPNNIYGEEVVSKLRNEPVFKIGYRDRESIFIKPANDRVTVIFSTIFSDEVDRVFSKVFLQEFSDARKRSIQKAPQVINSHHEIPLEIQGLEQANNDNKTYITFVLFPRHLATTDIQWHTITQIETFRSYFHYHIKIVKCYLHQRMRHRVQGFTKVLNRARRDVSEEEMRAERKTASGRRFEQR